MLADSIEVKTWAFSKLFEAYGPDVQKQVVEHHRNHGGMTRVEKFKHYFQAFLGREIGEQELSKLCSDFSQLVVSKVIAAPEIPGAKEFVGLWHEHTMCFVNSAVPTAEIREIVKGRDLERYFYEILGAENPKAENTRYLLDKYALAASRCLFFGDAFSDYQAASECGTDFLGIVPGEEAPLLKMAPGVDWVKKFDEINFG